MDRGFRPSPSAAHLFVQQDVERRRRPHHWQPLVFPSWHSRYTRHSRRRSSILCLHSHSTPTPSQADDGSRSGSGSVSNPREHPYRAVDLLGGGSLAHWLTEADTRLETDTASSDRLGKRRPELAVMVERQRDKWPWTDKRRRFNPSKTRYGGLKAALLDEFGFTTPSPSAIVGSVDDTDDGGAMDADEGTPPARCVHSTPTGPTADPPTAASDHDRDVDSGCSHSGAGPASTSTHRTVRVFIEDRRPTVRGLPASKSVELMDLDAVDAVGCSGGEWRASARQLISQLQGSCAAIEGPVKLSYPDPVVPQYSQYFVKMAGGEALVDARTSPSALIISAGGTIQIFVEAAVEASPLDSNDPIANRDDDVGIGDQGSSDRQPLPPAKRRRRTANELYTPEYVAERRAARGEADKQQVAWLEQKASETPGYGAFVGSRGRTLQNAEVVASWRFAVAFTAHYVGEPSGVMGPSGRVRMVKKNVAAALGHGPTWFSQAERGMQFVLKYGEGSDAVPEVQRMLRHHDSTLAGSAAPLSFLQTWDAQHGKSSTSTSNRLPIPHPASPGLD